MAKRSNSAATTDTAPAQESKSTVGKEKKVTKKEVKALVDTVIDKVLGDDITNELKELKEALDTVGSITLVEDEIKEAITTAKKLRTINFQKINYVVNPTNQLITLGNGFTIKPYHIISLKKKFTNAKDLEALRRSVKFVNAIKNGLLIGYEDLDLNELKKLLVSLKTKSRNVVEEAEKRGIKEATDLRMLMERDPKVVKYFEEMMEKIRRQTNTANVNINVPQGQGHLI